MCDLVIVSPNLNSGGAEKVAVNLANYYSSTGIDIKLLLLNKKGQYLTDLEKTIEIISLDTNILDGSKSFYVIKSLRSQFNRIRPKNVLSVVRNVNFLVGYSCYGLKTNVVFREANTMHELNYYSYLRYLYYINSYRLGYIRADKVIANSPDTKNDLVRFRICRSKKISVIPNPVVPDNISQLVSEDVDHPFFNNSNDVIINIGRLVEQKNQEMLIKAFAELSKKYSNLKLLILGEGYLKQKIDNKIHEYGLQNNVDVIPFRRNVYNYLARSKLFVLTSKWEGFGNVIVEALASGTPVVSTNCNGGPSYIIDSDKYGLLSNNESLESLVTTMEKALSKKWDKEILKEKAMSYKISDMAKKYSEHFI